MVPLRVETAVQYQQGKMDLRENVQSTGTRIKGGVAIVARQDVVYYSMKRGVGGLVTVVPSMMGKLPQNV